MAFKVNMLVNKPGYVRLSTVYINLVVISSEMQRQEKSGLFQMTSCIFLEF